MFIFYSTETGAVAFTIAAETHPSSALEPGLAVVEVDLPWDTDLVGWRVIDGALVQVDLGPVRQRHLDIVRQTISDLRSSHITTMPGQELIYLAKQAEAVAYLAAAAPDLADYPMMQAEVGVTAPTGYELAQVWLYMAWAWQNLAAQMERARMLANAAIMECETQAEIEAASDALISALAKLGGD